MGKFQYKIDICPVKGRSEFVEPLKRGDQSLFSDHSLLITAHGIVLVVVHGCFVRRRSYRHGAARISRNDVYSRGAIIHRVMLGPEKSIGWRSIVLLTLLTVATYALDFLSGYFGAKYFGATKWGMV